MDAKSLMKNKTLVYSIIAIVVAFVVWYFWEGRTRATRRTNWINWMKTLPDNDEYKALIIKRANEKGITVDEEIVAESYYRYPTNVFKKASKG